MKVLNLTQHPATAEQKDAGVFDLGGMRREALIAALTFYECPTELEVWERAQTIADLATQTAESGQAFTDVMIGGAPFLMPSLRSAIERAGFCVCYAFSKRESVEYTDDDGNVVKRSVFRHAGFVWD
jgi:hypothetical protein